MAIENCGQQVTFAKAPERTVAFGHNSAEVLFLLGLEDHTILAGVAASQLFNSLTSYIFTTSGNAQQAHDVMFWLLGGFGGVRWPDFQRLVVMVFLGLAICLPMARSLDAFTFGDEDAAALGVPFFAIILYRARPQT